MECRKNGCTDFQCPDAYHDIPIPRPITTSPSGEIVAVRLDCARHRVADVMDQINALTEYPHPQIVTPNSWATFSAKHALWTLGVFHESGPSAVIVSPVPAGGVAITLIANPKFGPSRESTIVCGNDKCFTVIGGPSIFGQPKQWKFASSVAGPVLLELRDLLIPENEK